MAIIRRASGFDICPLAFRGAEFSDNVIYLAYLFTGIISWRLTLLTAGRIARLLAKISIRSDCYKRIVCLKIASKSPSIQAPM